MYRAFARIFTGAGLAVVLAGLGIPLYGTTAWELGDLFVGIGNGSFQVTSNAGAFKETLPGTSGDVTGGCAIDASLNAYLVNTSQGTIIKRALASPAHTPTTISTAPDINPQSIVFAANGDFYVGHIGGLIQRYVVNQTTGNATKAESTTVSIDSTNSLFVDMAADQRTLFYTSGGRHIGQVTVDINSSNVATFGVSSTFATLPNPNSNEARALRVLPPPALAGNDAIIGGILVADKGNVKLVNAAGTGVVREYDQGSGQTAQDDWFALGLDITDVDEAGTDQAFWAGDKSSGIVWRFKVGSSVATNSFTITTTGAAGNLRGLCLNAEPTTGQYSRLLKFDPATTGTITKTAVFAAGTPALEEHSFTIAMDFTQVPVGGLTAVVNAREAISDGICSGGSTNTSDVDCGFVTFFSTDPKPPKGAPYAHGRAVYYHVKWMTVKPLVNLLISSESNLATVQQNAGTCTYGFPLNNPTTTVTTPRALRILRDPSNTPEDDFAQDLTDSFFIDGWGAGTFLNRFIVAARCATGTATFIKPVLNKTFKAGNSVPIEVNLFDAVGNPITNATTAPHRIAATVGTQGQVVFVLGTPGNSPNFFNQVQNGQYIANLSTTGLSASTNPYFLCITDRIEPPNPSEAPLYQEKCVSFFLK